MKRAVAYARFSSDLQREEPIEAQTRAIQQYCDANGFVLLTVFADRGISGTSDKRPEFQKMISTATKGGCGCTDRPQARPVCTKPLRFRVLQKYSEKE